MIVTKDNLREQFNTIIDKIELIKNLGMVYAREKEDKSKEEQDIMNQPYIEQAEVIVAQLIQLKRKIEDNIKQLEDIDTKSEEYRDLRYEVDYCEIELLYLSEKLLFIPPNDDSIYADSDDSNDNEE